MLGFDPLSLLAVCASREGWLAITAKGSLQTEGSLQLIFSWPSEMCSPSSLQETVIIPMSFQPTPGPVSPGKRRHFPHGKEQSKIEIFPTAKLTITVNCGTKFADGKDLLDSCSHSSARTKASNPIKKLIFPDGQKSFLPSNIYSDGNLYTRTLFVSQRARVQSKPLMLCLEYNERH